ncbi:hypothetical protein BJI45_03990 [Limosilactobacillus reuteri]|uniref:Malate dehydrogenase n=1 Tax=Limosilactobacillus reuteri TaxID=1598 RepID=A0AB36HYU4_LIMRT|nr:hypothetical protein BJI45_03990 [Limosilactobacillus reuteri]
MRIQATDERHYLVEVFTKFGFNQDDSQLLADTLVDADLRGISSHGIQRLAWYRRMIKEGTIIPQKNDYSSKKRLFLKIRLKLFVSYQDLSLLTLTKIWDSSQRF